MRHWFQCLNIVLLFFQIDGVPPQEFDLLAHGKQSDSVEVVGDDLVLDFHISYPCDGDVLQLPLIFTCTIVAREIAAFMEKYANKSLCLEIDHELRNCTGVFATIFKYDTVSLGKHIARMVITDTQTPDSTTIRYHESALISFTVLSQSDFEEYGIRQMEEERRIHGINEELDLPDWFQQQYHLLSRQDAISSTTDIITPQPANVIDSASTVLVIGIKTIVTTNFRQRQAIRDTWASKATLHNDLIKILFIGCRPDLSRDVNGELEMAINLEKHIYGDLLVDELDCDDAYNTLSFQVKEFLIFAAETFNNAQFVMIADDDIYLRIDRLLVTLRTFSLAPKRFYAGQTFDGHSAAQLTPTRSPSHRYFLSDTVYSMRELPRFALGPHFVLSMDCVRFIAKNRYRLQPLGAMDDITIALWMLLRQVHPQHFDSFQMLRYLPCNDGYISFADLSSLAIRVIHQNLQNQRNLCHGFNRNTWAKRDKRMLSKSTALHFSTYVRDNLDEVVTFINTNFNAGAKFSFVPSAETVIEFAERIFPVVQTIFQDEVELCLEAFTMRLQRHFQDDVISEDGFPLTR